MPSRRPLPSPLWNDNAVYPLQSQEPNVPAIIGLHIDAVLISDDARTILFLGINRYGDPRHSCWSRVDVGRFERVLGINSLTRMNTVVTAVSFHNFRTELGLSRWKITLSDSRIALIDFSGQMISDSPETCYAMCSPWIELRSGDANWHRPP